MELRSLWKYMNSSKLIIEFEFLKNLDPQKFLGLTHEFQLWEKSKFSKTAFLSFCLKMVRIWSRRVLGPSRTRKAVLWPRLARGNSRLDFRLEPYFRIFSDSKIGYSGGHRRNFAKKCVFKADSSPPEIAGKWSYEADESTWSFIFQIDQRIRIF